MEITRVCFTVGGAAAGERQRARCREHFPFYGFKLGSADTPERNGNVNAFQSGGLPEGQEKPSRMSAAVDGLSVHHITAVNFNKALLCLRRGAASFSSFSCGRLSTVQLRSCLWEGVYR